jgi:uncharacterized caspase-like protein
MANYWAIAIGINQYKHFQPLMYAQRDAQIFRDALVKDAAFPPKQCFLLTDAVPGINRTEATPTRDRIQACIAHTCRQRLYPGDVLWCFFSGYGVSVDGKDYLVPIDADPNSIATSGISMEWLFSTLAAASTRNIVLLLDVNRKQGMAGAMGEQTANLAKVHGIPTILSCRADQVSSETLALRQGLFTTALLEAIRYQKCHTLEQFAQYLGDRLPELSVHHCRPPQHPVAVLPAEKRHQIMRPVMRPVMRPEPTALAANAVHPSSDNEGVSRSVQASGGIPVYGYSRLERNSSMAVPSAFSYDETTRFKPDPLNFAVARKPSTLGDRTSDEANPIPVGSIADLDSTRATQAQWSNFRLPRSVASEGRVDLDQVNFAQVNLDPSQTANPNSIAAPIQSPAIESSQDEQPEISDRLFWRRVRTWGGILVAALLMGVIVRHGSNQTQNNAASLVPVPTQTEASEASESTVEAPSQPAIQAEPGSPLETAYVAVRSRRFQDAKFYLEQVPSHQRRADYQKVLDETNKGLLSDAKIALTRTREFTNENQASDFIEALETVRLIRPDEPHYAEAQEYVDRWSRIVFDMAQGRADRRNDSSSTVAADNYSTAIRTIRLIPEDAPVHERAQSALAHWSQRLFELASDRAVEGKYDVAVYVAELIPADAPIYAEAQAAIESWRTQPTRFIAPTP